jgi:hypothetical protein
MTNAFGPKPSMAPSAICFDTLAKRKKVVQVTLRAQGVNQTSHAVEAMATMLDFGLRNIQPYIFVPLCFDTSSSKARNRPRSQMSLILTHSYASSNIGVYGLSIIDDTRTSFLRSSAFIREQSPRKIIIGRLRRYKRDCAVSRAPSDSNHFIDQNLFHRAMAVLLEVDEPRPLRSSSAPAPRSWGESPTGPNSY